MNFAEQTHRCRFLMICCLSVFLVTISSTSCLAQPPRIQTYFDEALTATSGDCVAWTTADLFVVAQGFDLSVVQLEYSIAYPASMVWLGDTFVSGSPQGCTATGIVHSWINPQNLSGQVLVTKALFMWTNCYEHCDPVCVRPHPTDGWIRALESTGTWVYAEGWGSPVCPILGDEGPILCEALPAVPINLDTWGAIKELYR